MSVNILRQQDRDGPLRPFLAPAPLSSVKRAPRSRSGPSLQQDNFYITKLFVTIERQYR